MTVKPPSPTGHRPCPLKWSLSSGGASIKSKTAGDVLAKRKEVLARVSATATPANVGEPTRSEARIEEPSQIGSFSASRDASSPRLASWTRAGAMVIVLAASIGITIAFTRHKETSAPITPTTSATPSVVVMMVSATTPLATSQEPVASAPPPPSHTVRRDRVAVSPAIADAGPRCGYHVLVDDAGLLKPRWVCE